MRWTTDRAIRTLSKFMNTKSKVKFFLPLAFALLSVFAILAPAPNLLATQTAQAAQAEGAKHTSLRMVADVKEVVPGSTFMLGVELTMQPGWHTYYKESGDAGMPTSIEWVLPPGYKHGDLLWKKPHKFDDGGIVTYGYAEKTVIAAKITAPDTIPDGEQKLVAKVKWLECKELCIPGSGETSMILPAGKKGSTAQPGETDAFKGSGFEGRTSDLTTDGHGTTSGDSASSATTNTSTGSAPASSGGSILDRNLTPADAGGTMPSYMYFALAVLGGFILNFMPCVLPVIAIKIISLMEQVNDEPGRVRLQGLVFAAGILSSFLVLGALVLAAREAGQSVGWGFQMQYPPFVIAMATIIMIFSLSLFGLFYVTVNPGQEQMIDWDIFQRSFGDSIIHSVHRACIGPSCRICFCAAADCYLRHLRSSWPRHVVAIFVADDQSKLVAFHPQTGCVDGEVQGSHGICSSCNRSLAVERCWSASRSRRSAVGWILLDWYCFCSVGQCTLYRLVFNKSAKGCRLVYFWADLGRLFVCIHSLASRSYG